MAKVCKFHAGTKTVDKLSSTRVDENGIPVSAYGKCDKDEKWCKTTDDYTDGTNIFKRYSAPRGYAFFGPQGDTVVGTRSNLTYNYRMVGSPGLYLGVSNDSFMDENGVEKYRLVGSYDYKDKEDNKYHYDLFAQVYQDQNGNLCAYNKAWKPVYENENGETRMPNDVFDCYKDLDGNLKKGSTELTSVYEIPNSVCAITEINGENVTLNVTVFNTVPPTVGKILKLTKDDILIVPKGSLDAYKNDAKWGKFKNISEFDMGAASSQPAASATSDLEERLKKIEARLAALEAKMK